MEEAVVGAVVGASIQVLLQSLIFKSMEQINLIWDFKEDLGILKDSLRMIKAYLSNAEVRRLDNEPVEIWLQQLESVAFKADAVLDEINYQLIRKKVENKRNETVSLFFLRIEMDRRMANKIKDINKELEIINKNALSYGLHMSIVAAHHSPSDRETDSFRVDPIVVGREKDLSKIVEMLVTNPTEDVFSIIPIVGMGGLGKTTLAREVFNDEKITNHFDKKIWVCVPENYDAKTLFKMILETGENFVSREVVLKKIHHHIGSKRYLLVLDDLWSDDPWDDFISSLLGVSSAKGNGIIVTTRKEKVAERVQTLPFYRLSTLSDDDCWSIIKVKAFKGVDVSVEFEEIGKSIAQRCKGLPLAAKVVGGSLKGNTREEWLSFLESEPSYSSQDEKYILKVLKLSFDRLPSSSLKKCFAYCSIFPQNYWFCRDQLIELWMAEGFLQSNQKNDMETEGNKFFNHLLQNSLFKDAMRDEHGCITHCKMHNLVHELACSVSGMKDSGSNDMHRVRYLHLNLGKDEQFPISQEQSVYLRTLFWEGTYIENLLSNFKCLHVLKIIGCDLEELPIQIQNLIHLRYLEISCIKVASLPDWIGKLYNLQTLRTGCMTKLPNTLINLICLRHLHIYSSRLPPGIGKLTCLQTLPYYKVSHEKGCGIGELGSLKNLRGRLEIQNLEMVSDREEATHADLYGKANITHLVFAWSYDPRRGEINDESVLEGLQPPQNLKSLEIKGYKGINFPLWTMKMTLNNLIDMTLSGCDNCEEIPMLGHLPHLKSLSLIGMPSVKSITLRFYGIESCSNTSKNIFPALEKLELFRMPSLTEWVDAQVSNTISLALSTLGFGIVPT